MALELLLLLHADAAREWTAEELNRELRASIEWVDRLLQEFAKSGLVTANPTSAGRFRYAEQPEMDGAMGWLAKAYPELRFSISQVIFSAPSSPIQSFADAFKLRKDKTDG